MLAKPIHRQTFYYDHREIKLLKVLIIRKCTPLFTLSIYLFLNYNLLCTRIYKKAIYYQINIIKYIYKYF
jgi:hypothetical protein